MFIRWAMMKAPGRQKHDQGREEPPREVSGYEGIDAVQADKGLKEVCQVHTVLRFHGTLITTNGYKCISSGEFFPVFFRYSPIPWILQTGGLTTGII